MAGHYFVGEDDAPYAGLRTNRRETALNSVTLCFAQMAIGRAVRGPVIQEHQPDHESRFRQRNERFYDDDPMDYIMVVEDPVAGDETLETIIDRNNNEPVPFIWREEHSGQICINDPNPFSRRYRIIDGWMRYRTLLRNVLLLPMNRVRVLPTLWAPETSDLEDPQTREILDRRVDREIYPYFETRKINVRVLKSGISDENLYHIAVFKAPNPDLPDFQPDWPGEAEQFSDDDFSDADRSPTMSELARYLTLEELTELMPNFYRNDFQPDRPGEAEQLSDDDFSDADRSPTMDELARNLTPEELAEMIQDFFRNYRHPAEGLFESPASDENR